LLRGPGTAALGRAYLFLRGLVLGHRLAQAAAFHTTTRIGHHAGGN